MYLQDFLILFLIYVNAKPDRIKDMGLQNRKKAIGNFDGFFEGNILCSLFIRWHGDASG